MANGAPQVVSWSRMTESHLSAHVNPHPNCAAGKLVKVLVHTDVTRYLDFKLVDGSYVYRHAQGIHRVPVNGQEALASSLVGFFQKLKLKSFLEYVAAYNPTNPATFKGECSTQ